MSFSQMIFMLVRVTALKQTESIHVNLKLQRPIKLVNMFFFRPRHVCQGN